MSSGYLRHFDACNRYDLSRFVPFYVQGRRLGHIKKTLVEPLTGIKSFVATNEGIALAPDLKNFNSRSDAFAKAIAMISDLYDIPLRNEMYPVIAEWGDQPLAQIDRAAVPWFGVRAFGVHINGFVRQPDGIRLWIGERAIDRIMDPGKLDNIVGGGQPIGLTLEENLCKEAAEEAAIDPARTKTAQLIANISYISERNSGLRTDTLFVYDLELPADFKPRNTDGEVAAFHCMTLPEVAALVRDTDRFKFNCNLVIIDFLMRHGFIDHTHPEYDRLKLLVQDDS